MARTRGLRWRRGLAYYEREHRRLLAGRITVSLATRDADIAQARAAAVNTLFDRGDWAVLQRLAKGELHITDIARAAREGEWNTLRRLEGTRLGAAVDRALADLDATRAPQTAAISRVVLRALVTARGADYRMADETRESANAFLHEPKDTIRGEVWSANTQRQARGIYSKLWRVAIEDELEKARPLGLMPATTDNPWKRANVPVQRATRHAYLTPEQWHRLMAVVAGTPTAAFLGVCCLAGLRQAEATYLRPITDVALSEGVLRVQSRQGRHAWRTKADNSQRDVPIVSALRALLEEHVALRFAGERFFFRLPGRDQPISPDTTAGWCRAALEAVGIRYGRSQDAVSLHSLRHTFGSWLALDGVPIHVIASLMGNTPEVVLRYYSHLSPSDRDAAMLRIQERVG